MLFATTAASCGSFQMCVRSPGGAHLPTPVQNGAARSLTLPQAGMASFTRQPLKEPWLDWDLQPVSNQPANSMAHGEQLQAKLPLLTFRAFLRWAPGWTGRSCGPTTCQVLLHAQSFSSLGSCRIMEWASTVGQLSLTVHYPVEGQMCASLETSSLWTPPVQT